eukprot:5957629-Amphidinium_carterae.1
MHPVLAWEGLCAKQSRHCRDAPRIICTRTMNVPKSLLTSLIIVCSTGYCPWKHCAVAEACSLRVCSTGYCNGKHCVAAVACKTFLQGWKAIPHGDQCLQVREPDGSASAFMQIAEQRAAGWSPSQL